MSSMIDPVTRSGKHGNIVGEDGNGSKSALAEVGPVQIDVAGRRGGSSDPKIVRERQHRLSGSTRSGCR